MIIWIILAVLFFVSCLVGGGYSIGLTEDDKIRLIALLIFMSIALVIFGFLRKAEEKIWNNGFCSCGGRWEYMQPIGHAYNTYHIYKCDKCGKMHEFSKVRD